MSLRTRLLGMADRVRGIPGKLDLRQNVVTMRVRQWSGCVAGEGAYTDTDTILTVNAGAQNVRVREVSMKDIVSSGGQLTAQDLKVGPFTPEFTGGGTPDEDYEPFTSAFPREVWFLVTGRGMPPQGRWYKRTNDDNMANFTNMVYLRATAETP